MIKSVLVDLDGMLIPQSPPFYQRLQQKLNTPQELIMPFYQDAFKRCLVGKADMSLVIRPYLRQWGWEKSFEAFLQFWFESEGDVDKDLVNYLKTIDRKNVSVYLATNQEKYRLRHLIDQLDLLSLFDHIFASSEIYTKKPEPAFYQYIYKSVQYLDGVKNPTEVMYWDDQPDKVRAAKKFGFDSHQYLNLNDFIQHTSTVFSAHS